MTIPPNIDQVIDDLRRKAKAAGLCAARSPHGFAVCDQEDDGHGAGEHKATDLDGTVTDQW